MFLESDPLLAFECANKTSSRAKRTKEDAHPHPVPPSLSKITRPDHPPESQAVPPSPQQYEAVWPAEQLHSQQPGPALFLPGSFCFEGANIPSRCVEFRWPRNQPQQVWEGWSSGVDDERGGEAKWNPAGCFSFFSKEKVVWMLT